MAIRRHEPCPHGQDKNNCPMCLTDARLQYLEDRVNDLEVRVFGEVQAPVKEQEEPTDA